MSTEACNMPLLHKDRLEELADHPEWATTLEVKALVVCVKELVRWCGESYVRVWIDQHFEERKE